MPSGACKSCFLGQMLRLGRVEIGRRPLRHRESTLHQTVLDIAFLRRQGVLLRSSLPGNNFGLGNIRDRPGITNLLRTCARRSSEARPGNCETNPCSKDRGQADQYNIQSYPKKRKKESSLRRRSRQSRTDGWKSRHEPVRERSIQVRVCIQFY